MNQIFLCFNRGKFSFTKTHELNLSSKAVKKLSNAQRILAISINSLLNWSRQFISDGVTWVKILRFKWAFWALALLSGFNTWYLSNKSKKCFGSETGQLSTSSGWAFPVWDWRNSEVLSAPFPPTVLKWPCKPEIPLVSLPYRFRSDLP